MILEEFKNTKGRPFVATIKGAEVKGRIQIEDDKIFLCQDNFNGSDCKDKLGYKFSWCVESGINLERVHVTSLEILDYSNPDSWCVGDVLTDGHDINNLIIIFVAGEAVITKDRDDDAQTWTKKELIKNDYKIFLKDVEEIVHLTIQDISEGKGKGIPAHLIRIKE